MKRRLAAPLAAAAIFLLIVRIMLPVAVKAGLNRTLQGMEGHSGRVDDVDLFILGGDAGLQDLRFWSTDVRQSLLVNVERVDFSLQWKPLFKGRLVFSATVQKPSVWLKDGGQAKEPAVPGMPAPPEAPWDENLRRLFPVKIEKLIVSDGLFVFAGDSFRPPLTVRMEDIDVEASNLTNSRALSDTLFAGVRASARMASGGELKVALKADPVSRPPAMDMDFELKGLELKELNAFFKKHGKVDVQKGTFSMAGEAAVKQGRVEGYVRPALENVEVFSWKQDVKQEKEGALRLLWEGAVEAVKNVFESEKPQEQVATRIPFQGAIKSPDTDLTTVALNVLRNAFLEAILPMLEHSVSLGR